MKYIKEYNSSDKEIDYLDDLFTEWSDKWHITQVKDIAGYSKDNISDPVYSISLLKNTKYLISVLFPDDYGDCGVNGSGRFNKNSRYLSQDFMDDMNKFISRLRNIGYDESDWSHDTSYQIFSIVIYK